MRLIAFILLLSFTAVGQTPSFVPRTNNTGSIGTSDKQWGTGYFNKVYYDGEELSNWVSSVKITSFNTATGAVELVAGDGIKITTNGSQLLISFTDIPTDAIGTNRVYFRYSGYTNYWTVPSGVTQISAWVWGGAGVSPFAGGGAGGFSFSRFPVTNSQIFQIVVGQGGTCLVTGQVSTAAFGGGGIGQGQFQGGYPGVCGGGGFSGIFDSTNKPYIIAGGGGAGTARATGGGVAGSNGGGLSGVDGGADAAGGYNGRGGTQTSGGAKASVVASRRQFDTDGSYLQGGAGGSATNGYPGGGGGGGYYGGGGGFGNSGSSGIGAGGAGSGFIASDISISGITIRSPSTTLPAASELPEYISGIGVPATVVQNSYQNTTAGHGLIVIGY